MGLFFSYMPKFYKKYARDLDKDIYLQSQVNKSSLRGEL